MPFLEISISTSPDQARRFEEILIKLGALFIDSDNTTQNKLSKEAQINIKAVFLESASPRKIIKQLKKLLNHPEPINYRIKKIEN